MTGRDATDRKLVFVGILNRHLPRGRRAVLVGGSLVEFYTSRAYTSGDIDLVGDRELVGRLLVEAGFEAAGRYFVRDDLELVVEVPGSSLRPTESVVEIEFEGYRIPAVSVEDSIVDRLLAAKHWRSTTDWEQAILLYASHQADLVGAALRRKASMNEVGDKLDELEALVRRK